jgi:hypothetical protein
MFLFGHDYYGWVDRVPGLFYVKTRFFHIWWFPLVPKESWVVADDGQDQDGYRIPLCWKSVIVAWSRYFLGFMFMCAGLGIFLIFAGDPQQMKLKKPPLVVAGCVLALMAAVASLYALTYWWARPSEDRAFQLAKWMGADPSEVADRLHPPKYGPS